MKTKGDRKVNYKFRQPELEQFKAVFLTREGHETIKKQKKIQKLSMAKIIDNLIKKEYGTKQTIEQSTHEAPKPVA